MMLHQALRLCEELARLARSNPQHYGQSLQRAEEIRQRFMDDASVDTELSGAVSHCIDQLRDWLTTDPAAPGRSSAPLLRALRQLRWAVEYSYDSFQPRRPLRAHPTSASPQSSTEPPQSPRRPCITQSRLGNSCNLATRRGLSAPAPLKKLQLRPRLSRR